MHKSVIFFKQQVVEARFFPLLAFFFAVILRFVMLLCRGVSQPISYSRSSFVWQYIEPYFVNPYISFVASTVSILIIASLLFHLDNIFNIIPMRTSLPFSVFPFIISIHPYFLGFSPDYIAIILFVAALKPFLSTYQHSKPYILIFEFSLLLAIATIFEIYVLLLFPIYWIISPFMGRVDIRVFVASLFALFLVYWSIAGIYFFVDKLDIFTEIFKRNSSISWPNLPDLTLYQWVLCGILLLIFMTYIILTSFKIQREKIFPKLILSGLSIVAILMLFAQFLFWINSLFFVMIAILNISFLISYYMTLVKSRWDIFIAYGVMAYLLCMYILALFSIL